jgi:hypothetical protein
MSMTLKTLCAVSFLATAVFSEPISGTDYYRYWMYFKSIKLNYDKAKISPEDYPDQVDEIGVNEHQQAQGIRSTSVKKAQTTEHFLPTFIIPYFESIYEADIKEKKQDMWSRHPGLKAHRQYIDWYEHKIMLEDKVNAPQYSKMQSLPNAYLRDELENVNCQLKDDRQRLEYAQQQLRKHLEKEPPLPEISS